MNLLRLQKWLLCPLLVAACGSQGTQQVSGLNSGEASGTEIIASAEIPAEPSVAITASVPDPVSGSTPWTESKVADAITASGLRVGDGCDSGRVPIQDKSAATVDAFSTMQSVARMYSDGTCLIIAWGLAPHPVETAKLDIGEAALAQMKEFAQSGEGQLLLFDDNGKYVGAEIEKVQDPSTATAARSSG